MSEMCNFYSTLMVVISTQVTEKNYDTVHDFMSDLCSPATLDTSLYSGD